MKWIKTAVLLLVSVLLFSCQTTNGSRSGKEGSSSKKKVVNKYIESLNKAVKNNPENAALYFELGMAYYKTKQFSHAEKTFKKIMKLKNTSWQDKAVASVHIAKINEMDEDYKEAIKWYKNGMHFEGDKGTYVAGNYGLLIEKQQEFQTALVLYHNILQRKNLSRQERLEFEKRVKALSFLLNIRG